jgi:hypothetical protein
VNISLRKMSGVILNVISTVMILTLINGCSENDCQSRFEELIKAYIADGDLSQSDLSEIKSGLSGFRDSYKRCFSKVFTAEGINEAALIDKIKGVADRLGLNLSLPTDTPDFTVKAYIENSLSMHGYTEGRTEFKDVLSRILIESEHFFNSAEINFINTKIYPQDFGPESIWEKVSNTNPGFKVGNIGSTDINKAFDLVLSETDDKTVTLFFSDCIYSIKGTNTNELLDKEKNLLQRSFLEKSRYLDLDAYCGQYFSKFSGVYYNMDDAPIDTREKDISRPYYIWIFGKRENVEAFLKKVNTGKYPGFKNGFHFTKFHEGREIAWSVLPQTSKIGRFATNRDYNVGIFVHGIEDVKPSNGRFQVGIGINLAPIIAFDSGVLDPEGYLVSGSAVLTNIANFEIPGVHKNDFNRYKEYFSHFYVLTTEGHPDAEITIRYPYDFPQWIVNSSTVNDLTFKENPELWSKTFGFEHMCRGIWDSYNMTVKKNYLINIKIHIER